MVVEDVIQSGLFKTLLEANGGNYPRGNYTAVSMPEYAGVRSLYEVKGGIIKRTLDCAADIFEIPPPTVYIGASFGKIGGFIDGDTGSLFVWGPKEVDTEVYLPFVFHEFNHGLQGELNALQETIMSFNSSKKITLLEHLKEFESDVMASILSSPHAVKVALNKMCVTNATQRMLAKGQDSNDTKARSAAILEYYDEKSDTHPTLRHRVANVEAFEGSWADRIRCEVREGSNKTARDAISEAIQRAPFHIAENEYYMPGSM